MRGPRPSGKRPVEQAGRSRAGKAKLERVSHDVAESANSQEELKQLYRSIMDNAHVGITLVDQNYRIRMANNMVSEYFCKPVCELVGRECFREFEKRASVCPHCPGRRAMETGQPAEVETEGVRDDGSCFPVRIQAFPTIEPDGSVTGFVEVIEDVTGRKKAEQALRESEERFRGIYENALVGLYRTTPDGRILMANPALLKMLGYSSFEELAQRNLEESGFLPDYPRSVFKKRIEAEGQVVGLESRWIRRDGTVLFVRESARAIRGGEGKTLYYEGTVADITESKQADEALQESKERFRHAFDNANVGMCLVNIDGFIMKVNDQMCEIFGYKSEELQRMHVNDIAHPEDVGISPDFIGRSVSGEIESDKFEKRYIHRDGHVVWCQVSSSLVRDSHGEPLYFISHVQDITERKRAEQLLRKEIEKAQTYLDVVGVMLVAIDSEQKVSLINKKGCEILGYEEQEILGKNWFDNFLPKEVGEEVKEIFENCINGEIDGPEYYENPVLTKKGDERLIAWHNTSLKDQDGNVTATLSSGQDITEHRRAENALRASEHFLQDVFDGIKDGISVLDRDLNIVRVNAWTEQMYAAEMPLVGRKCYESYQKRDSVCPWCPSIRAMDTGEAQSEVVPYPSAERPTGWIELSAFPLRGVDGSVTGVVEHIKDITERKKAEEALRDAEAKYRTLFENLNVGVYRVTPGDTGRFIDVNPAYVRMLGYNNKEEVLKLKVSDTYVDPSGRAEFNRKITTKGFVKNEEIRLKKRDGTPMVVSDTGKAVYDGSGELTCFEGVLEDITERRHAERVRLAHLRFLESLDRVNRAIQGASDLDQMMSDVLDVTLSVFNCDRAWVLHPCDPDAASWRVPMERTVPEYPGAMALGIEVPMDQETARVLRTVLESDGPVKFGPESEHPLPKESAKQFRFQSQISMAVRPKVGRPWMFGLHQCSHPRVWTDEEEKLLQEIGRRVADSMSSLLTLRDLRESQERYRALVENANLGIALISKDFEIIMSNATQGRMLREDHRDFIGRKCYVQFEKRDEVCPHCPGRRAIESGHVHEVETQGVRADGTRISVRVQASPVYGEDGDVAGFVEIVEDITERKQTEQRLLEDQAQLKSLASQLSLTEERERRQIATDLHDRIGQSLVTSKIKLDELRQSASSDELAEALVEVSKALSQVIQDTRTLTFDLSFPILYELGFEAAVAEWLNGQIGEKYSIKTEFEDDGRRKPLDDDIRVLLFRNVRELLINVVKHASAQNVKVSIRRVGKRIVIRVEDDGVGFNPAEATSLAAERATFGLFSIRERLEQLGGHLEIKSEPGRGCRITMTAPLRQGKTGNGAKA